MFIILWTLEQTEVYFTVEFYELEKILVYFLLKSSKLKLLCVCVVCSCIVEIKSKHPVNIFHFFFPDESKKKFYMKKFS